MCHLRCSNPCTPAGVCCWDRSRPRIFSAGSHILTPVPTTWTGCWAFIAGTETTMLRTSQACVSGWAGKQSNWQLAISKWPNLIATVCGIIAKQKRTKKQTANFHDNPNRETSRDSVIRKIRGLFCGPALANCQLPVANCFPTAGIPGPPAMGRLWAFQTTAARWVAEAQRCPDRS
jgi:hypothetical protein